MFVDQVRKDFAMTNTSIAGFKRTAIPAVYPPAPQGRILYVIGDIHGRRDLLERVFRAIDGDKARARDRAQDLARPQDAGSARKPFARLRGSRSPGSEERALAAEAGSPPYPSSFIGLDLNVNGLIEVRGDVHIDGHVCGVCAGRIVVGKRALIEGSLVPCGVGISDSIKGIVRDNLTLGPILFIKADVLHKSLVVEHLDRLRASDHDGPPPSPAALEIYLGDYIDRGEDSRGVVDALIERAEHVEAVFLRGNHEQLLLDFLAGTLDLSLWKQVGGGATLQSYGIQAGQPPAFLASQAALRQALDEALTERHARFYADTVPYFVAEPYLFVHAGLRPGIPLQQQHPADLMGIRRQFLEFEGDLGHIVVHGHTPSPRPEFKHNRINLDTGAYSTGNLTCLRIGRDGAELLEA